MKRILPLFLVACSSTTTPPPDSGAADGAMTTDASAMDSGAGSDASTKPATPQLLSVEPLTGGLHVMWKLNDIGLTNVELWRKVDAAVYAKLATLPGAATSYHDGAAGMASSKYCYQVKTIRGADTSDLSNEVCGSP